MENKDLEKLEKLDLNHIVKKNKVTGVEICVFRLQTLSSSLLFHPRQHLETSKHNDPVSDQDTNREREVASDATSVASGPVV